MTKKKKRKFESCNIEIADNWFIRSDPYQYILVERKRYGEESQNKGEWYFDTQNQSYYRTLAQLTNEWGRKMVRMSGSEDIGELISAIRMVESTLASIARQTAVLEEKK